MKTYQQFQQERLDESIVGKAAGIVNRAMSGARKIGAGTKNMLAKTTTPSANQPPKPKRPFQADPFGPNKRKPFQPKPKTTPNTPAPRSSTAPNIPSASVSNIKAGAKRMMRNPTARSVVKTGANMVRNIAGNIRGKTYEGGGLTKQFTGKSGLGKDIRQGISDTKVTSRKGGLAQSTIGQRLNRVFNKKPNELKARALGQKFRKKFAAQDAAKNQKVGRQRVTSDRPDLEGGSSGAKVTTGGGKPPSTGGAEAKVPATSGGKSKETGKAPVKVSTGTTTQVTPAKVGSQPPRKGRSTDRNIEGDADKIRIGKGGRQQRITGGDDPLPIRRGKVGNRRGRPPGSTNKKPESPGQQTIPGLNKTGSNTGKTTTLDGESKVKPRKKNQQGLGSKVADGAKKVAGDIGNAAKNKAKEVAGDVGNAAKNVASNVGNAAKNKAKEVASNVGNAAKNKAKEVASNVGNAAKNKAKEVATNVTNAAKNKAKQVGKGIKDEVTSGAVELSKKIENKVAAGKKKRDEARSKTRAKVTTNFTKPKPGQEMKAPEKKDKVTVNTSVDTSKQRERQKKNAPKQLAQAVANQSAADAARDAVRDIKKTPSMGKVTDDVRSKLNKTIAKTASTNPKASTQIKGKSDEQLTRTTKSTGDEGKFTNKYTPPSKTESQNIQTQSIKRKVNKANQSGTKKSKGGDAKSGGGNAQQNINPIKKRIVKKTTPKKTNESFSDWREEFLWEVDKKYPDKVKEIKPMSGKNTITINPEDESSKYKRGY